MLRRSASIVLLFACTSISGPPASAQVTQQPGGSAAPATGLAPTAPPLVVAPIDGWTTMWHTAPERSAVPRGGELRLKQVLLDLPRSAELTWQGAREVQRSTTASIATCSLEEVGTHDIRVELRSAAGHLLWQNSCRIDVVDLPAEGVQIDVRDPWVAPLGLDAGSSNAEIVQAWFQVPSVAPLSELGAGRWSTSVQQSVHFEVTVEPPGFAPLVEWRLDGQGALLGAELVQAFQSPGSHVVEVGPPALRERFELEIYAVTIAAQDPEGLIPEGVPVTFTAVTEPRGFERDIVWLAATKYGSAKPLLGRGPTFTALFADTWKPQPGGLLGQWVGVRAGNVALGQDQKGLETVKVNPGDDLQAVVDQAPPNSLVLVNPDPMGPYGGFVLNGKPLRIMGCAQPFPQIGPVQIIGQPAGSVTALADLELVTLDVNASAGMVFLSRVRVSEDFAMASLPRNGHVTAVGSADVRLYDVDVDLSSSTSSLHCVEADASRVEISSSDLVAAAGEDTLDFEDGGLGGLGLRLLGGARAHVALSNLIGGDGGQTLEVGLFAGDGGHAIQLEGVTELVVSGQGQAAQPGTGPPFVLQGGDGGEAFAGLDAPGGSAISLIDDEVTKLVRHSGVQLVPGTASGAPEGRTVGPVITTTVVAPPQPDPSLATPQVPVSTNFDPFPIEVSGPPGANVNLLYGVDPTVAALGPAAIEQLLDPIATLGLGQIPVGGVLTADLAVNGAPQGICYLIQAEVDLGGGIVERTNSVPLIVR